MRRRRRALAMAFPQAADEAAGRLPAACLSSGLVVAGYHPVGAELDPGPLLARFARSGARIVLPVTVDRQAPLIFRLSREPGDFIPDALGVQAPGEECVELVPDLVIAPVLAFDRTGGRLGQGAGAFDRTLAHLRARGSVFVVGLAFAGQEVPRLPLEPHDQRLDAILTETGYIEVRRGPSRCA